MSGAGFRPYVLWRRGMLPARELDALVPARTWAVVEEIRRGRDARAELAAAVSDEIYRLVPAVAPDERRDLLKLRRDLHNDRLPAPARVATAQRALSGAGRAALAGWLDSRRAEDGLLATAEATFADELREGQQRLARLAGDEEFLRGVQLSGRQLYRDVRGYVARGGAPAGSAKEHRRIQSTIVSFAARASLRPSPFGSFTEVGAHQWRPEPSSPRRLRLATAARGLLTWMAYELHRIDGADQLLRLRRNHLAEVRGERVELFTRGADGGHESFGAERFVTLPHSTPVRLVLAALDGGPLPQSALLRRLTDAGVPPADASAFLDRLVAAGLCHRDLALPDQTPRLAEAIAARLAEVPTGQAAECARVFTGIQRIEDEFAGAGLDRRERLLAELDAQVHRFTQVCGMPPPPSYASRAPIFEDVGGLGTALSWRPALLERNAERFELMHRLLPVFDDSTIEHLGLYRFVAERFGPAAKVPLLEVYRAFAKLAPADMSSFMLGAGDRSAEQVRRLRGDVLRYLAKLVDDAAGAPAVELDGGWLREFVDALPPFVPAWTDSAFRLQFVPATAEQAESVVVGDVTVGNGVFLSRFCDLLDRPGRWSLAEALRASLRTHHPRHADLTAVLGANVNLHPRLAPLEIVYPGAVGYPEHDGTVNLRELLVAADPVGRRLRLVTGGGAPVELVPMNFLFPAAAPMLYRFLCVFAPVRTFRRGLWERLRHGELVEHQPGVPLPRLTFGDLVLDRRSWQLPAAAIPADGAEEGSFAAILQLDRWRRELGLPTECFFRRVEPRTPAGPAKATGPAGTDWLTQTHRWALEARNARLRKPHFLDFRNPYLLRVFGKHVRAFPDGLVVLQEALPAPSGYLGVGAPPAAEELLVEFGRLDGDGQ